jgi:hypothetical protein
MNPSHKQKRLGESIRFRYDWTDDASDEILVSGWTSDTLTIGSQLQDGTISSGVVSGGALGVNALTLSAETATEQLVRRFQLYVSPGDLTITTGLYYSGVGAAGLTDVSTLTRSGTASFTASPVAQKVYFACPAVSGTPTIQLDGWLVDTLQSTTIDVAGLSYYLLETSNLLTGSALPFTVSQ